MRKCARGKSHRQAKSNYCEFNTFPLTSHVDAMNHRSANMVTAYLLVLRLYPEHSPKRNMRYFYLFPKVLDTAILNKCGSDKSQLNSIHDFGYASSNSPVLTSKVPSLLCTVPHHEMPRRSEISLHISTTTKDNTVIGLIPCYVKHQ